MQSTLTQKGQITLPRAIRAKFHLQAGDKVEFILDPEDRIQLIPLTTSVTQLKGMVPKPKKRVSLKAMREAIEEAGGCL